MRLTRFSYIKAAFLLALLGSVSACGPSRYGHIRNVYRPEAPITQGVHKVREGDTLYTIAFRYNRKYEELAAANNINPPYKITPGQIIYLGKVVEKPAPKPTPIETRPDKKQPTRYKKPETHAKPVQEKVANQRDNKVIMSWRWPASGSIIRTYSLTGSKINKGIDLAGSRGEPVYATADGEVVYSGTGLVGYGNLIILKHNEQFLSAYAHNSRLLIKEGQSAKAGQKIAEIGSTGANRNQLHFEIRKDGKPVNPLQYLPAR